MGENVGKAKDILMRKYAIEEPNFTYVTHVKPNSFHRTNNLVENTHIRKWMDEECIDTGEYSFTRGNHETIYKGTAKYAFKSPNWNEEAFAKAWEMVNQRWSVVPKVGLATEFEDWVDMTTSPGYPFSMFAHDKRAVMEDQELLGYMRMCFDKSYCNGLWSVRCKSEPTKQKKLIENNGRVIVSAPMDVQVVGAKLFGPMNNRIYQTARQHRIPCTVGLSKFYQGWHHLYLRLTKSGRISKGLELDYTNYDGTCTLEEFEQVMNLRFGLLKADLQTPQMKEVFVRYYQEIVYTKMVLDSGEVVMKHNGNPSGQVNTIVDNSIINEFRWYYVWCSLAPENLHNLDDFSQNCELLTCGDDSVFTVMDSITEWLKPSEIIELFESHGWKPKFASPSWQPVHTLNYCSQNFRWLNGWVVPVPNNFQKLLASLLWGGERRDARETLGRLLGVKIESYFLTGFRNAVDRLISELFDKYYPALKQRPRNLDEFTYEELCILNRGYSAAYGLYLSQDEEYTHVSRGLVPYFDNEHLNDIN